MRFNEGIESKKGKIPSMQAILNQEHEIKLWKDNKGPFAGYVDVEPAAFASIIKARHSTIIFPLSQDEAFPADGPIVSRFLGKVAIEGFAHKILEGPSSADSKEKLIREFTQDETFIPLKRHVRRGVNRQWVCNVRRIYSAEKRWFDTITGESYQVMNEFDFLLTDRSECYFILALFGMEYAINMGGPTVDGYVEWLKEHNQGSPLYWGKDGVGHQV